MARKLTTEQRSEIRAVLLEMQGDLRELRRGLQRHLDRADAERQRRDRRRRRLRRLIPFLNASVA